MSNTNQSKEEGSFSGGAGAGEQTAATELQRIHAVVMNVGGDWPDDERDPYTLRHVKWMARQINNGERCA